MRIRKAAEAKHNASQSPATSTFIDNAKSASIAQLFRSLKPHQDQKWREPRGDLYHWIPLLNIFDHILEDFTAQYALSTGPQTQAFGRKLLIGGLRSEDGEFAKGTPEQELRDGETDENLVCLVLDFTRFLLDNCANRSLYNSSEHLTDLLNSTSLSIVVSTLHLGARLAATYYRSSHNRPAARHSLSSALLTSHYRIDPERVQKLAEPFAANLQKIPDGDSVQAQTPVANKGKEVATPGRKATKQSPKIHPNDLLAFAKEPRVSQGDFSEFAVVCYDTTFEDPGHNNPHGSDAPSTPSPATPTPARRVSVPSRLSRSTVLDDAAGLDSSSAEGPPKHHKLVINAQVVQTKDIHEILAQYLPRIPADLRYGFLVRLRFAKALSSSVESRRLALAVRILALANISFLYPESLFQQKVLQQDSTEARQLQIVYQLADVAKPSSDATNAVPLEIVEDALEALEAIATRHKSKHSDIINALGINVNHGTLFQLLRSVVDDLKGEGDLDTKSLEIHETIFGMLDNLLPKSDTRNSARTVDTLVSTGLFGVLVQILQIHSNRAQRTQHRVLLFVNEGMHVVRDGIRAFANADGLEAVSRLVAWEVDTCLDAVRTGQGLPRDLKSRLMDYDVPVWHQQTLRTILKVINHMLGHSSPNNDRLLRNLIDNSTLLKAMNDILRNGKTFGSNIYSQVITMVTSFIHNEPQSFNIIAEAGLSKSVLESIRRVDSQGTSEPRSRKLPIEKVAGRDLVVCGKTPDTRNTDLQTFSISRSQNDRLASNILCSSDVMSNLPAAFGAICLNPNGRASLLASDAIESYFELFESPSHVKAFAAEPTLAEMIGQGFDELVRHHPDLKTAVMFNVILTIARIDYRCRKLLSNKPEVKNTEAESGQSSSTPARIIAADDVVMSGSDEDIESNGLTNQLADDKEPDALAYIGAICKFLMTFFGNHNNMTSMFVESGGLPFLLDLCSLPSMPHDSIKFHGYGSMHSLAKAVHMVVDAKPHIALPMVLKHTSDALDQVKSLQDYEHTTPFFQKAIDCDTESADDDTTTLRALTQVQVYTNLLQEIFSAHGNSSRDRNQNMFAIVNLTDMYVDVIRRMGLLSRFCIWELVTMLAELPESAKSKTAPTLDGYGDEAARVMELETIFSRRPTARANEITGELGGSGSAHAAPAGIVEETPDQPQEPAPRYSSAQLGQLKSIRHLMTTVPDIIFCFFHNIGEKIVPRRRIDSYQRQNAFLVAEVLAEAAVAHLKHASPEAPGLQSCKNAFSIIAIEQVKSLLNCDSSVDSGQSHGCITIILPALRNRGGLSALLDMLKHNLQPAIACEFDDAKHTTAADTPQSLAATSAAIVRLALSLFQCLTSSRYITEAHQSQILTSPPTDTNHLSFNPAQLLVELRYEILPAVEYAWNEKGSEKLDAPSLKKMIRILRTVLEADNEHGAAKTSKDVQLRQPVSHTSYRISQEKIKTLRGLKYQDDVIFEALYRCCNDRDRATDYCDIRNNMHLPRFPIPAYEQSNSTGSENAPAASSSLQPEDAQSAIIPDRDLDEESQVSDTESQEAQDTTNPGQSTVPSAEHDAEDGRMAMSIGQVLNISESDLANQSSAAPKVEAALPPIQFALQTIRVGIEDLSKLRAPLRKNLITRVMDMLAVEDDKLSFDLAELLTTAANKSTDEQEKRNARREFGETLIHSLVSFNTGDDFRGEQANISAIANLLAILLQEHDFYEACIEDLQQFIDPLLDFIRVFPNNDAQSDSFPWIGQILLIFERLLSEELQPAQIEWQAPSRDGNLETSDDLLANYRDPILDDDQREKLFDSIIPVLPRVGKDRSLALSVVRILVMLTRERALANKLAAKSNLQKLFLMIKQLAGLTSEKLQSAFMLVLRHISEDDDSIRKTMRNGILTYFKNSRQGSSHDTTSFVRHHYAFILRAPKTFLEVVNETVKIKASDDPTRPQLLVLKPDVEPELFSPWEPPNIVGGEKQSEGERKIEESSIDIVPTTESANDQESADKNKAAIKPPVVEHPGGLIHFILSQLLLYKDIDDQEAGPGRTPRSGAGDVSSDVEMEIQDNTSDDEPTAPHANAPGPPAGTLKTDNQRKEEYKAEDHPIYQYRCFLLQCLTELLLSYNQAKVEFINYSRKADPKAMTPSKPKSGVLNYLLSGLIPLDHLERSTSVASLKKQGTSTWASSVIVALCLRTPETMSDVSYGHEREARESDLLFVRKFVIEHAIKIYRDIQSSTDVEVEVKYARMLSVSDLFNRILLGRTQIVHSSAQRQPGESPKPTETEIARIMFEKNLISVLTTSLSEIDLSIASAKRAIKYILRPLRTLTVTAATYSQNADLSATSGQTTEEDDISTATSVSDVSDEREETPDLFRHSALGMLEPGHDDDESSSESDDEDEEMYEDDGYGDDVEFEEDLEQADADEAVSDPEDEEMGSDGGMEGRPGEMPLNMEVVIEDDDDLSPDEDDEDDEDEEDDDDEDEDDDDDEMDEDGEIEILEEIEHADGDSLDDNEDDWEDEVDDSGDPNHATHPSGPSMDDLAEVEAIAEEFAQRLEGGGAHGGPLAIGGGFRSLEEDVENGTYMDDLRLVRDGDEDGEEYPDDEDADDLDEDEGDGDFMYETYGDDEEGPFDMMDEAFGFLGGVRPQSSHFLPSGFRRQDVIVTPDGAARPAQYYRGMRTHNRSGTDRNGPDDGVNPLLQRRSNESYGPSRLTRPRPFEITGPGSMDFLRLMRSGEGGQSMIQDMFNAINPSGTMPGGIWATVRNEELEFILGRERSRPDWAPRDQRQRGDDVSTPPPFIPSSTVTRWQEEAKLLYANQYVDKAHRVVNSLLKLLVPQAMKEHREREERAAEERRIAEEQAKKEEEERRAKEEADRLEREREEQRRREEEEEAARQAAAAETTEEVGEEMEGVETEAGEGNDDTEAEAGPSEQQPRVMTNIRGRQVDITDLGIDQEYLDALPEELREEVIMQAVAERRVQQPPANAAATEPASNVDPAFLDALPEDLRQEIIAQEEQLQRRRARQEEQRRQRQAAGAPAGAEEMDTGSFLASLDPILRRQVLMEQALSRDVLDQLPDNLREEAEALLMEDEARQRDFGRRYGHMPDAQNRGPPGYNRDDPNRRAPRRQIVQMLDKSGIATILRLLFVPQQGSLKESMGAILHNISLNRQSRAELVSLLLTILQDGSLDANAVERSYATLTMRSKQPPGAQQTPKPLKRSMTGGLTSPLGTEITPIMVIQQCLAALVSLVQHNGHAQTFFLNPHETPNTLKNKTKQKGKGKENLAQKYALNALLSLLDRKMIMENAACMEQLSTLLIQVTRPLDLLRRQERNQRKSDNEGTVPAAQASETAADASDEQTEPEPPGTTGIETNDSAAIEEVGQSNAQTEKRDNEVKKSRAPSPPIVPESNLQLVINIITSKECGGKTFRDTLATINHLSAIPGAKDIFGRELVRQAQSLGETIAADLQELLTQLSKETGSTVQSAALSKFSPASSDQTKLLRVLMALDYLFAAKASDRSKAGDSEASQARNDLLSRLYESPTFNPAWTRLSECLKAIQDKDNMMNVATILSPLIEALMVVCKDMTLKDKNLIYTKSQQFAISSPEPESTMDTLFFRFTEDHRKILNELVRNNPRLMSGTFALLVKNPKVLEFDNKRNYFNRRMHTRDDTVRRGHAGLSFTVRRDNIFLDSYQKLFFKKPEEVKFGKLNIKFTGEEGVDAGGVTREWFQALTRQFFNPDYALFVPVAADRTTFHPSKLSWVNPEHVHYFKFIGRIIGKALYENRPLDCHFSRAVYKRILGKQVSIKDMETLDLEHYRSLVWTLENDITDVLTETFSVEQEAFGETQIVDLIPDGRNVAVTDENKHEWVQKLVEHKLTGSVDEQLKSFLQGFHEIVPSQLISIFNEQELELLISGLPEIDIEDWKANTEYQNYNATSAQIQWFWRAVRSFDKEERAKLLQFVTGTSKVPLNGFKELEGMNGFSKFNIHRDYGDKDRLPSSHTCFNQLDLPEYDDYETLRSRLYTALTAGGEYFGFA